MKSKVLYHVSPENFEKFSPKYCKVFKCKGVYLTNYSSAIKDWMPWVLERKRGGRYSYVYLYKIRVSNFVFKKSSEFYEKVYNSEKWSESQFFFFWNWGYQLFIPEEFVPELRIWKKKKFTFGDSLAEYKRIINKEYELRRKDESI